LMVGGSIQGQTRVLATTVFDHVELMEYTQAHIISAGMLVFSFLVLLGVYIFNRKFPIHVS
jgi:molybdate transport system permease protein